MKESNQKRADSTTGPTAAQTPKQEPSCLSAGRLLRKNNSLHIALEAVLRQKLDGLLQRGVHVEGTADGARLRAVVRRFKGAVIGGAEALVVVQLRAEVRVRLDEQTVAGADDPGDGDARIIAVGDILIQVADGGENEVLFALETGVKRACPFYRTGLLLYCIQKVQNARTGGERRIQPWRDLICGMWADMWRCSTGAGSSASLPTAWPKPWRNCASSPPRDVAFTAPGKGGIIAKNTAAWREGGCLWPAAQTRS